mgnify:CR=1 FL=1
MLSYLWGGSNKTEKPENENPELAMREQLDSHGDFHTKSDGTMELKDFLVVRSVVLHQALRHYKPQKDTFKAKALEFFKKDDMQAYATNFAQGQKAYNDAILFMTKKACEWIDFDVKSYNLTMQEISKDKESLSQVQKRDAEVREAYNKIAVKYESGKEKAIEAVKYKIQEELAIHRKM